MRRNLSEPQAELIMDIVRNFGGENKQELNKLLRKLVFKERSLTKNSIKRQFNKILNEK